jgi:hypothetical protein
LVLAVFVDCDDFAGIFGRNTTHCNKNDQWLERFDMRGNALL